MPYIAGMIAAEQIDSIVTEAARRTLGAKAVERAFSEPTVDSVGKDALRVTIVLKPKSVESIDGDSALDTLVKIQHDLEAQGEERRAIVGYATEDDLKNDGD